jgi:hypothetical protein
MQHGHTAHPGLTLHAAHAGKSFYTVDPSSGLILTHTDVWDAVSDNSPLSLEAVQHVVRQVLQVQLTPDLEGPRYSVLKKAAEYEVRQYQPYVVAETQMPQGSGEVLEGGAMLGHARVLAGCSGGHSSSTWRCALVM